MKLYYKNKKDISSLLETTKAAVLTPVGKQYQTPNKIIKGDNLEVMQALLQDFNLRAKIDLVYIDPPFATNTVFKHSKSRTATVSSSCQDDAAYSDILVGDEYLEFLRGRLIFIRELMAEHASIYLHIDYKVGHYVKVIMDEIFGQKNFRNDITRIKCNPKNFQRKGYSNIKDLVLFYTKTDDFVWNEPRADMSEKDVERLFSKTDQKGRRYTTTPLHAPGETKNGNTGKQWKGLMPPKGRHWRYDPAELDKLDNEGLIEWSSTGNPRKIIYADNAQANGKRIQDIWEFKDSPYPSYPTEKNLDLLNLIIQTSSNPGQLVFDCFCGSGSTLLAAHHLHRYWIGIDNSNIAIQTTISRFTPSQDALFDRNTPYNYFEANINRKDFVPSLIPTVIR
ncbi:MAG: site-specific DNA-methyltransferase [Phycisphaerae bacterium]|nr:site-specific DNA-methyltransferase [Phycisphaerae bacterium]